MGGIIFLIVLILFIAIIAYKSIKVVKQSEVYIIERLGKFHKVADAGLTIIFPFVDHVRSVVSLKQQTMDIPPQGVITQDNVTITIDTVVFYQITDPAKAVYEIQSLKKGIEYLAITTIRDIVGKMSLDETFSSRDLINQKLRSILDEATASIDPENEHLIQEAISALTHGKTIITIAHRLATIENADQILVIDGGTVAQRGTHKELLQQEGTYKKFIQIREQAEGWRIQ